MLVAILVAMPAARAGDGRIDIGRHHSARQDDTHPLLLRIMPFDESAGDALAGIHTLAFAAERRFGDAAGFRFDFSVTESSLEPDLWHRFDFRGRPLAPAVVSSDASYPQFWRARASYWRELYASDSVGALWLSTGFTYVLLDGGICGSVMAHDCGAEFRRHVLPVPSLGIHWSYSLTTDWSVDAGIEGGYLPWINSLRRDGSVVQFSQSNTDADIGLRYGARNGWVARLYLYALDYRQRERSQDMTASAQLSRYGIGVGVSWRF